MVLLVFDLTRADSFDALNLWRDQFLSSTRNDPATFPFAVIANKCDLELQRAVSKRKANTSVLARGDCITHPFRPMSHLALLFVLC